MKKSLLIVSLIIIFISIAVYFTVFWKKLVSDHDFILNDTSVVSTIIIKASNKEVNLNKYNNKWMVDRKFQANQPKIKYFLRIFSNLKYVGPIPLQLQDSIRNNLFNKGINIKIFTDNKQIKEYNIGNLNSNETGNYVIVDKKYSGIINVPGLSRNLSKTVSSNPYFWRNKIIFNLKSNDIKKVIVENNTNPDKSFIIETNTSPNLFNSKREAISYPDSSVIKRYLSYFQGIYFEKTDSEFNQSQKDSIFKTKPLYHIVVQDNSNNTTQLRLFKKSLVSGKKDLNFIYGRINNENYLLIISYYQIDPILKDIDYFMNTTY